MKQLRYRVIFLAFWLVIVFNLFRLLEPLNISKFTYTIALGLGLLALILPRVVRIPLWLILSAPVPMVLIYKAWTGALVGSVSVPIIFMELCIICVTTLLAVRVNMAITEFESSVAKITIGNFVKVPEYDPIGQGLIYREFRRARNHQRPLTLMRVAVNEPSIVVALDRMVQEAQQVMIKQYILSNVSKTLSEKLEDSDIIVQVKDHFLIVLPETEPEDVPGLIGRLRQQVADQVGVELRIGAASLPRDGFTYEGLIEKVSMEMEAEFVPHLVSEGEHLFVNHHLF